MSTYAWTDELHSRLVTAIESKLRAPNGNPELSALAFASIGEVAHEIADAVEACWVPTEVPGTFNGKPKQTALLVPILSLESGDRGDTE